MNVYGGIVKGVAVAATSTKNSIDLENLATIAGNAVRVTRENWERGVAEVNTPRAQRLPKTTTSRIDTMIDNIKKKGATARTAYIAASTTK
jgi:hypothetical protein